MAVTREKLPDKLSSIENFALGATAAIISKTASAPMQRVKILFQCQGELVKQGTFSRPYTGFIHCITHTYRNEGLISFWRGNLITCIRYFPTQALNFALKDTIKATFKQNKNHSYMVNFAKNIASGGVAGALSLLCVYSLDYTHTRLVTDVKTAKHGGDGRKFNGIIDVYKKTLATDGIAGLYRGFIISCGAIFIYRGCYFGLYDTLKPIVIGPNTDWKLSYLLGYGVTVTSGLISYPFDTARRRMMMTSGETVKYKGALDCISQIIRNEGSRGLFRGAGINIVIGIVGAGLLVGFDSLVLRYTSTKIDTSQRS